MFRAEPTGKDPGGAGIRYIAAMSFRTLIGRWLRQGILIVLLGIAPILLLEGALRLAGWPTQRVRTLGKLINVDPETFRGSIGMYRPGAASTKLRPSSMKVRTRSSWATPLFVQK